MPNSETIFDWRPWRMRILQFLMSPWYSSCSVYLPKNRTAASPGFLQERLALKSNAGRTAKGSKQRAIKQIYVTYANGFLLCGIMIIRNRKFKRIMVKQLVLQPPLATNIGLSWSQWESTQVLLSQSLFDDPMAVKKTWSTKGLKRRSQ